MARKTVTDPMIKFRELLKEFQDADACYTAACVAFNSARAHAMEKRTQMEAAKREAMTAAQALGLVWRPNQMFKR